ARGGELRAVPVPAGVGVRPAVRCVRGRPLPVAEPAGRPVRGGGAAAVPVAGRRALGGRVPAVPVERADRAAGVAGRGADGVPRVAGTAVPAVELRVGGEHPELRAGARTFAGGARPAGSALYPAGGGRGGGGGVAAWEWAWRGGPEGGEGGGG